MGAGGTRWPITGTVRLVGTHLDREIIDRCRQLTSTLGWHDLPAGRRVLRRGIAEASWRGDHRQRRQLARRARIGRTLITPAARPTHHRGDEKGWKPRQAIVILPDVLAELPRPSAAGALTRSAARASQASWPAGVTAAWCSARVMRSTPGAGERSTPVLSYLDRPTCWRWGRRSETHTLAVGVAEACSAGQSVVLGAHIYCFAAAVFAQGCSEIDRMLELLGATRAAALGLPGAGDFYVTAMGGRTVRLGRLLGQGNTYTEARRIMAGETLESAEILRTLGAAFPLLTARGLIGPDDFPLLRSLGQAVVADRPIEFPIHEFFRTPAYTGWLSPLA